MKQLKLLVAVLFLFAPFAAHATVIYGTDSGRYYNSGNYVNSNGNTCLGCGDSRVWVGFDLSGLSGSVTSATLSIYSAHQNSSGQTINWWDVSSSYASLGAASTAIWTDLGSGTLLASGLHTAGVYNNFVLNGAGLANLQSSLGSSWAIGAGNLASGNYAIAYTTGVINNPSHYQLIIETGPTAVPEPGSLALLGLGLAGMTLTRRKNKV